MSHTTTEDQLTPRQMKSIFSLEREAIVREVEVPKVTDNHVLVRTTYSGISNGTERLMISHNHKTPISLGYSACGIVHELGEGVEHVKKGEQVACYGAPYVKHAEYLLVPKHLVVPVPQSVDMKQAAFVGLGAIAIHALRQAKLAFGEKVVVVGLGILGQIIAQISQAAAYHTIVYDLQAERSKLFQSMYGGEAAESLEDVVSIIDKVTHGNGVDSVLLCASGKNTGLIDHALDWVRDRGNVVIVGDLEMEFSREKMFRKEAEVLISRAGGPGRYDSNYEKYGYDYPIGFVRWTEGRNMEEYIRLLQDGRINVAPLISQESSIDQIEDVYKQLTSEQHQHQALGTLIRYDS